MNQFFDGEELSNSVGVLETMKQGLLRFGPDMKILAMNAVARSIFEQIENRKELPEDFIIHQRYQKLREKLQSWLEGKDEDCGYFALRNEANQNVILELTFSEGSAQRGFVFVRDLTEQILRFQQFYWDSSVRELSFFASGVAHEFNNLLAGMSGYLELAKGNENYVSKFFQVVEKGIGRGAYSVERIMDFTIYKQEKVNLSESTQVAIDLLRSEMDSRRIVLSSRIANHVYVSSSFEICNRLIYELLSQAILAVHECGEISVHLWPGKDSMAYLEISEHQSQIDKHKKFSFFDQGVLGEEIPEEWLYRGNFFYLSQVLGKMGGYFRLEYGKACGTSYVISLPLQI